MKRYNFYKCRVEYGSSKELLKIVLVDNKFEYDSTFLPVGEFDEHSSLTEFFSAKSVNLGGYSLKKFFDNLRKNIDENRIIDLSMKNNVLHVVTQRFSDKFCRNVETFDFVFDNGLGNSVYYDAKLQGMLSSLLVHYKMDEIHYINKAHSLIESNYNKRVMYKQFFLMFGDYCKDKDYNFEDFFVAPEEFIEFCEENAYLLISDYYEFNKKKIFTAHSRDGTISYYDSERDISSGKFGSKVLSVYSKNPSLAKNILKVGGAVGKVFGCKYLYDIKVINIFEQKFNNMISDIKSKYFVMGYEDGDVPTLKS